MSCFNQNTAEYKALLDQYDIPIVVDGHIQNWQTANRSNIIPSVVGSISFASIF